MSGSRVRLSPTAIFCVLLAVAACGSAFSQAPATPAATAPVPTAPLPRQPNGRPDLQGLWLKSAGGFQGLFIGSLNGTNFANRGGPPPAPRF